MPTENQFHCEDFKDFHRTIGKRKNLGNDTDK